MEKNIQNLADKKINLMVLIVSMPVGGVETQVLSIIRRFNRERYNVTLCCIKKLGELGEKAAASGIKTISLNLMRSNKLSLYIPWKISRIVKENNIHILWTHQYVANLYGRLASLFIKVSVVPTFHVLYDHPKFHRKIFNRLLSYKTDIMASVSNAVADDIKRYDNVNGVKIKTIYNGIELESFNQNTGSIEDARKFFNIPSDLTLIGSVGRLTEQKAHKLIIEAVSRLDRVCMAIAGDGPLRKELKNTAKRLNVRCVFTGNIDNERIPLFLRTLDIFCFPSLWEGFGLALAEAMAAGLPIIASDIPPHREVLGDAGIFVPAGNGEALSEKIKLLTMDAYLRKSLAEKAKERAGMFSIENTVKAYENLFEEMLRKKKLP